MNKSNSTMARQIAQTAIAFERVGRRWAIKSGSVDATLAAREEEGLGHHVGGRDEGSFELFGDESVAVFALL
jgi:hypothetical protein